ncbi:hypothetical protein D0865_12724 [Hortaea werneckii]|uniref:Histone transcription regulator 3 homolog n=1 Tax=Hortaea werneckii TaxID=91943 RepID=A0A3M7BJX6_HORWE|nr:hypothetical protein D0865_12724 [Hortaea werneckii]
MSGWKALNIESDDESDIEIDDTKELQIEDALKLYQNAIKYHAEGPASFEKAAEAYQELFESEIFKYPESQTELQRIELYGPLVDEDASWTDSYEIGTGPAVSGSLDSGPSTLPQILHLSHKNYAQFKLEYLGARIDTLKVDLNQILTEASAALDHFVEALDKDDNDLDLWRRTATVGSMLDSRRLARFCLEAVLEGDEEGLSNALSLPGLEEGLAGEQLRELMAELDDKLSILQTPLGFSKRRKLSKLLKKRLSAYPAIIEHEKRLLEHEDMPGRDVPRPDVVVLKQPKTWAEMGEQLLGQLMAEQHGTSMNAPASAIRFDLDGFDASPQKTIEPSGEPMGAEANPVVNSRPTLPRNISEQFPGLDHGKPTAQPEIASTNNQTTVVEARTISLPSRKRDSDAAGLQDGAEEGRSRSKRTRARESTNVEGLDSRQAQIDANIRWEYEQQLNEYEAADKWMFETVGNLFERIGLVGFSKATDVRHEINALTSVEPATMDGDGADDKLRTAKMDILAFLNNYNESVAQVFTKQQGKGFDVGQGASSGALTSSLANGTPSEAAVAAPTMGTQGLQPVLELINASWSMTEEVAYLWIKKLLLPGELIKSTNTYRHYLWPENLKTMVVRTLVNYDNQIYHRVSKELEELSHDRQITNWAELIETIFELHLDVYTLIKQSNSGVDIETVTLQSDRLQRWSVLAREAMHLRAAAIGTTDMKDELCLRFLWAATFHTASSEASQDYIIECMNDLRAVFAAAGEPSVQLQNNAIMPELSAAALDREISRLTTKDFFLRVTSQDVSDPVSVIEGLEPLLLALTEEVGLGQDEDVDMDDDHRISRASGAPQELVRFLRTSELSVRLLLWERLRDAYDAIDHKPMVVFCYFRTMKLIVEDLKEISDNATPQSARQTTAMKSLRLLYDMALSTLTILQSTENALEFVDDAGLKSAVGCFSEILQLLQVFNVLKDSWSVGQTQPTLEPGGSAGESFKKMNTLVDDFQIYIWIILYRLLQEAIYQNSDLYPTFVEDKFDFLRCVHRNLGIRGICGNANRIFVRMLKDEFLNMTHVDGYDSEQAQVMHDLYDLNCFLHPSYELMDHRCTHDAFLDRGAAMQAVDLLLSQASKLPIRELIKHPLEKTIEKVHSVVPRKKPTEAILRNREIYRNFLRSPINPLDLFECLQGYGNELLVSPIPREDALLAAKGWHFLMGHISLTKFRSQKRTGPTATEDVDTAIAFFMQDLDDSMDKWETWFRLAQAYDTKIEESVVWSAEKLNNSMGDVVGLQRNAIHCYIMATALAFRSAELRFETSEKLTELYADFALRLYSSSREPFNMLAFGLDELEKFLSLPTGMARSKPFPPLRCYTAWKLSRLLFRRAIEGRPNSWTLHYMLSKCLWKMHTATDQERNHKPGPSVKEVLNALHTAIDLLPDKKDGKEKREPILEPHYKLVSIVHKMVTRGELSLEQAREALTKTPYARTNDFPQETSEWVPHMLVMLKNLRAADKANWHHRMIARAAHIVYQNPNHVRAGNMSGVQLGAAGAKHELTQQMFTKTMVLQVWRPESERPGRHFVYTARYTRFFTRILEELRDRAGLEALARRVRRRPHDTFEHALVWQDICSAYLRLLRGHAQLSEGLETSTFSNIAHEDFLLRKGPLETWMQAQDTGNSAPLDVLREVQDLKKLNQGLMKPGPIDDLIGDAYALLFATEGKQLWEEEVRRKQAEAVKSPPRNPMMSLTHLMNVDGTNDEGPATSSTNPAANGTTTPAAASITQHPDPAPVVRKKIGVGRREIRNCAEACTQKAIPVSAAKSNAAAATRVQVVIDASRPSATAAGGGGEASAETSAPGSIHDSADDESELSELEEEGEEEEEETASEDDGEEDDDGGGDSSGAPAAPASKPMFPGLAPVEDSMGSSPAPPAAVAATDGPPAPDEGSTNAEQPAGQEGRDGADVEMG